MSNGSFPVGHPQVLTFENKRVNWTCPTQNPYKGLLMVKVLPPRKLKRPLLPYRSKKGVLLFALCASCAEQMPVDGCTHDANKRAWYSAYTHFEACFKSLQSTLFFQLNKALKLGYRVLAINEVWNWHEWREGDRSLFKEFVALFLKMKVTNSGFPPDILAIQNTEERVMAKLAFIAEFEEKEGIRLEYCDIQFNESQRFIAKVCKMFETLVRLL